MVVFLAGPKNSHLLGSDLLTTVDVSGISLLSFPKAKHAYEIKTTNEIFLIFCIILIRCLLLCSSHLRVPYHCNLSTLTYRIVVAPTVINFGIFSQGYFLIWWATFINLEVFIWGLPLFDVLDTKFITFCHIFCLFSSIIAWIFLTLSQNFSFLKK